MEDDRVNLTVQRLNFNYESKYVLKNWLRTVKKSRQAV